MKTIDPKKTTPMQRRHLKEMLVSPWMATKHLKTPVKLPPHLEKAQREINKLSKKHYAAFDRQYYVVAKAHAKAKTALLFAPPAEALAAVERYTALVERLK